MLKTIFIIIVLYCLLSGKYKNYITIKTPIPLISKFGETLPDAQQSRNMLPQMQVPGPFSSSQVQIFNPPPREVGLNLLNGPSPPPLIFSGGSEAVPVNLPNTIQDTYNPLLPPTIKLIISVLPINPKAISDPRNSGSLKGGVEIRNFYDENKPMTVIAPGQKAMYNFISGEVLQIKYNNIVKIIQFLELTSNLTSNLTFFKIKDYDVLEINIKTNNIKLFRDCKQLNGVIFEQKTINVKNNSGIPLKIIDTNTGSSPPFIEPGKTLEGFILSAKADILVRQQSGEIYKTIYNKDIKNNSISL
jgi:hypothetical protein